MDLGCRRHTLRTHLHVRIANGDRLLCTEFVRLRISLSTWQTRLSFWVVPFTLSIIFGIPFLTRVNPHILWRELKMLSEHGNISHVVHSDPLLGPTADVAPLLRAPSLPVLLVEYLIKSPSQPYYDFVGQRCSPI